MAAYSLLPQDPSGSCEGTAPLQRRMERRRSSLDEPVFGNYLSNHQAPLCWSCFLPIFGNRPDMFDGDLALCFAEDNEGSTLRDDTCNVRTAVMNKGKGSPLVTIPSPVSILTDNRTFQQEQQHDVMTAVEDWYDDEAPELTSSNVTLGGDESPTGCAGSHYDRIEGNGKCTGDIINCNIVGGIEIQAVLQQGGMEIPFAATIPFPRARSAWYSGLETRPFSAGQDVTVLGKLQVGIHTSAVQ